MQGGGGGAGDPASPTSPIAGAMEACTPPAENAISAKDTCGRCDASGHRACSRKKEKKETKSHCVSLLAEVEEVNACLSKTRVQGLKTGIFPGGEQNQGLEPRRVIESNLETRIGNDLNDCWNCENSQDGGDAGNVTHGDPVDGDVSGHGEDLEDLGDARGRRNGGNTNDPADGRKSEMREMPETNAREPADRGEGEKQRHQSGSIGHGVDERG